MSMPINSPSPPPPPTPVITSNSSSSATATPPPPPAPPYTPAWIPLLPGTQAALMLEGTTPGMPSIELPQVGCDVDILSNFVANLTAKTQQAQMDNTKTGIQIDQTTEDQQNAKAQDQIKTWVKKCQASHKHDKTANILKWVKRIALPLACVGAAALTVASAGATSGLAALTIAMCAYSMAQMASSEAGGPSLSIADNLTKAFTQALVQCGIPKDEAEKHAEVLTGVVGCVLAPSLVVADGKFAGQLVAGVAREAGTGTDKADIIDTAVTGAAQLASAFFMGRMTAGSTQALTGVMGGALKLGAVAEGATTVAGAAADVSSSALDLESSKDVRDATFAQADSQRTEAQRQVTQAYEQQQIDSLKTVMSHVNDNYDGATTIMKQTAQTKAQIISNTAERHG